MSTIAVPGGATASTLPVRPTEDWGMIRLVKIGVSAPPRLGCQAGRLNLPRYVITWSGHLQACVQGWPSRNCGVFPAVVHDRSRT
jgi:hypothetical protein